MPEETEKYLKIIGIIISVLFGTMLIFIAISVLLLIEEVSNELFFALRLLLALGAGFVSSGILGNIKLETPTGNQKAMYYVESTSRLVLKAGGPIAITILVWIYSPEVLQVVETIST